MPSRAVGRYYIFGGLVSVSSGSSRNELVGRSTGSGAERRASTSYGTEKIISVGSAIKFCFQWKNMVFEGAMPGFVAFMILFDG